MQISQEIDEGDDFPSHNDDDHDDESNNSNSVLELSVANTYPDPLNYNAHLAVFECVGKTHIHNAVYMTT